MSFMKKKTMRMRVKKTMKITKLMLCLLSITSLNALELNSTEVVKTYAKSDVLQASFAYELKNGDAKIVEDALSKIVLKLDSSTKECKQNAYSVLPNYTYKDGKSNFDGYNGFVGFECEFNSIESYNNLTLAIDKIAKKDVKKSQNYLKWGVAQSRAKELQDSLRSEIIKLSLAQSERFSKELAKKCEVDTISFFENQLARPMQTRAMLDSSMSAPIASDEAISSSASVKYMCK